MGARRSLIALGMLATKCGPLCLETLREGVACVNGSSKEALDGGPALLYSMYGDEKTSSGYRDVVLFNALILKPDASGPGASGGGLSWECCRATETFTWTPDPKGPVLTLNYDGVKKELEVAGQTWPARAANTFIVSVDEQWRPTVRPLSVLINEQGGADVLMRIQALLPDGDPIRSLRVESGSKHAAEQ